MIEKIIIVILSCALTFFVIRGCNKDTANEQLQASITAGTIKNDSVTQQASIWKNKHDSVTLAKHKGDSLFTHRIDSLNAVCSSLKTKFLSTRDTIANLHDRLNKAFADNDTAGVWDIADSLNNALVTVNNQLFAWQLSRDSVSSTQLSEIERLQGVITSLQGQISQFTALLTDCTNNAAALAKTANAAVKKAKMMGLFNRIGIGLAAVALGVILIVK